ncbi:hypothetical protein [Allokutzneria sp. NRRL B-24872]|uniref:hypothetical protein n=1 Tax=Allokutzneria sp. NRRL B-24872 TaxID=1137961 RepID=UPI000A380939|nr:hypothetical protein [Allokutzneria sp. NRRL B-24872]
MSDFDLPPKRALPFEVRASMRTKLNEEMNRPRRRSRKSLGALFATVTLLTGTAVGGPLLLGAGDEGLQDGGMPDFSARQHDNEVAKRTKDKDVDLERCRRAAQGEQFGQPSRWRAVFRVYTRNGHLTAIRNEGVPVFCHATRTQVHLFTAPSGTEHVDHTVSLQAVSEFGFLAGSTSPDSVAVDTRIEDYTVRNGVPKSSSFNQRDIVIDGLFVIAPPDNAGAVTLTAGGVRRHRVTKLGHRRPEPTPAVTVTDRPLGADRSSPLGVELAACISKASATGPRRVTDAESWAPAFRLDLGAHGTAVVARLDAYLGVCRTVDGRSEFGTLISDGSQGLDRPLSAAEPVLPGSLTVNGLLVSRFSGRVAPEVRSMTLVGPKGQELPTLLGNGVFVALPIRPMTMREEAEDRTVEHPDGSWRARIVERMPEGTDRTRVVPAFKYV